MGWLRKNLANLISLSRIFLLPIIAYTALNNFRSLTVVLIIMAFFGDAIDGTIARKLRTESEFGRKMDSYADYIFYPILLILFFNLFKQDISNHYVYILLPMAFFFIPKVIGFYYLKTYPLIHLRSWQATSYPLMLWVIVSIYYGFNFPLLLIINFLTLLGFFEESLIFLIKKDKTDQSMNSIFQLLKK